MDIKEEHEHFNMSMTFIKLNPHRVRENPT